MKACSHWELAEYLLAACLPEHTGAEQIAFLFGAVEPDLNCTTYLKGVLHGNGVHGHHYSQVVPRIERLLHELNGKTGYQILDWYRLGKLTHFIADAFTYPHNSCFPGDLRAHMRYENYLAIRFRWALQENRSVSRPEVDPSALFAWFGAQHEQYRQQIMCVENDIRFILETVCTVVLRLTADAFSIPPAARLPEGPVL